jgi:ubiquinone/menaquinone biosynthesis C-methylase UbiE
MNEIENQEKIWDVIAFPWKSFRNNPVKEVREFLKDKKGKLIDIGCGSGRNFIKNKDIEVYAVDFSKNMIKLAEEYSRKNKIHAKIFKADAWYLPFPANFFNIGIYISALHCIPHKIKRENSIQELYRVLKPGARALISVWDKEQEKFRNSKKNIILKWGINQDDGSRKEYSRYYYLYDRKEINELIEKYFKIIRTYEYEEREYEECSRGEKRFAKRNLIIEVEKEL